MGILRDHAADIAALIPQGAALIEFGSGSSKKARILLRGGAETRGLCAGRYLRRDARAGGGRAAAGFPRSQGAAGRRRHPQPFRAAGGSAKPRRRASGFFPARPSAISSRTRRRRSCATPRNILGPGATLIIGVDLIKPAEVLNAAYNDAAGVTAEVQSQSARCASTASSAAISSSTCFEHHAFYNRERNRIEMHLASLKRQKVKVAGETIDFRAGETIHTENSYKYSVESLRRAGARRRLAAGRRLDRRATTISRSRPSRSPTSRRRALTP